MYEVTPVMTARKSGHITAQNRIPQPQQTFQQINPISFTAGLN